VVRKSVLEKGEEGGSEHTQQEKNNIKNVNHHRAICIGEDIGGEEVDTGKIQLQ